MGPRTAKTAPKIPDKPSLSYSSHTPKFILESSLKLWFSPLEDLPTFSSISLYLGRNGV